MGRQALKEIENLGRQVPHSRYWNHSSPWILPLSGEVDSPQEASPSVPQFWPFVHPPRWQLLPYSRNPQDFLQRRSTPQTELWSPVSHPPISCSNPPTVWRITQFKFFFASLVWILKKSSQFAWKDAWSDGLVQDGREWTAKRMKGVSK